MTSIKNSLRELIRRNQDRHRLRGLLLAGAETTPAGVADGNYFEGLRRRVRKIARSGKRK